MKLEKLKIVVKKLNRLFDSPDMATDFDQQLDQLLVEFDDARRPRPNRFMHTSHRHPVGGEECS